jgi:ankyrin repeat protein
VGDHVQPTGWLETGKDEKLFRDLILIPNEQRRGELQNWKVSQIEKLHQRLPFVQNYEAILHAAQWNAVLVEFLKNAASTVNVNARNQYGWTALIWASIKNRTEVVDLLLKAGADANLQNRDGWTALIAALFENHTEVVRLLLEAGANANLQDKDGLTALMDASSKGHTEVVELLLNAGADVNLQDQVGGTALIWAAFLDHTKVVELLLEAHADANLQNRDGWTALIWAAYYGYTKGVELLLKAGADVNIHDKFGKTALMHALDKGRTEVVELLRSKTPPLDPKTSNSTVTPTDSTVTPTDSTVMTVPKGNEPSFAFGLGLHTSVVICANALVFSILYFFQVKNEHDCYFISFILIMI